MRRRYVKCLPKSSDMKDLRTIKQTVETILNRAYLNCNTLIYA